MIALLLIPINLAATCEGYGEGVSLAATASDTPVNESSGISPGVARPGVWYTHNDAGGEAVIYPFSLDGAELSPHPVDAAFRDWEDLATGPCPEGVDGPGGRCIYIGDIGDNGRSREEIAVHVVPEPTQDGEALTALTWRLTYPEAPRDSETLLVHPRSGQLVLVTKDIDGLSGVFVLDEAPAADEVAVLREVATLAIIGEDGESQRTTGGDFDASGQRAVVRTYGSVMVWEADPCDPEAHWQRLPDLTLPAPLDERQGEAVSFDPLSGDIITSSEGAPMELFHYACEGLATPEVECDGDTGDTGRDTGGADDTGVADDTAAPDDTGRADDTSSADDTAAPGDSAPADDSEDTGLTLVGPAGRSCGCAGSRSALWTPLLLLGLRRRRRA